MELRGVKWGITSNEETLQLMLSTINLGTHYGFPFSATLASEDGSDILKMGCS